MKSKNKLFNYLWLCFALGQLSVISTAKHPWYVLPIGMFVGWALIRASNRLVNFLFRDWASRQVIRPGKGIPWCPICEGWHEADSPVCPVNQAVEGLVKK